MYEFEWRDKVLQEKIKYDIKQILENKQSFDTSCNLITIDAGKDNYLVLLNQGYVIEKYNCPEIIKKQGKLKIYNCGTLTMVNYERFEKQIDNVVYKDEIYSVRDNGAVMRLSKNERKRELDNKWTFGTQKTPNDYLKIGGVCVHKIIATGFLSNEQIEGSIIEHIDKNKMAFRKQQEEGLDMSELAATLDIDLSVSEHAEKEKDMEFIQSILDGEDEIETILPEDLDNLPKVSRYNNDKDWL